ncbi:uncharacterized protein LOC144179105 isoform X1 [Haemaphysalis longicornis]
MSTSSPGQGSSPWSASLLAQDLPLDSFLQNGVTAVPVAMVPTNGGAIRLKNFKTIQKDLQAASEHFRSVKEVRPYGKGGIICKSSDKACLVDLLKVSSFASFPMQALSPHRMATGCSTTPRRVASCCAASSAASRHCAQATWRGTSAYTRASAPTDATCAPRPLPRRAAWSAMCTHTRARGPSAATSAPRPSHTASRGKPTSRRSTAATSSAEGGRARTCPYSFVGDRRQQHGPLPGRQLLRCPQCSFMTLLPILPKSYQRRHTGECTHQCSHGARLSSRRSTWTPTCASTRASAPSAATCATTASPGGPH